MVNLEYSGDFASFDCPKCSTKVRITVKDGTNRYYYCTSCGAKVEVKSKKDKTASAIMIKNGDDLAMENREMGLIVEVYKGSPGLAKYIDTLDDGDKVKITLELL